MNQFPIKNFVFGILGGIAGGILGGLISKWIASQGFYAIVLPGALVGLGFGYAARYRHVAFGAASGIMALLAGLITEWKVFSDEASFSEFLLELRNDTPMTWILIGIGGLLGYSFGIGRSSYSVRTTKPDNSGS